MANLTTKEDSEFSFSQQQSTIQWRFSDYAQLLIEKSNIKTFLLRIEEDFVHIKTNMLPRTYTEEWCDL